MALPLVYSLARLEIPTHHHLIKSALKPELSGSGMKTIVQGFCNLYDLAMEITWWFGKEIITREFF